MIQQVGRWLGKWLLIFFISSILIFYLIRSIPASPVSYWLSYYNLPHTKSNIAWVSAQMGLDKPLFWQYVNWLRDFCQGNWGYSLISGASIKEIFLARLPYTLCIGLGGILLAAIGAFWLGYYSALHRHGFWDMVSSGLAIFSQTIPSFIIAMVIIYYIGVKWHLIAFFSGNSGWALTFAILLTALYSLGSLSRVVCHSFQGEMNKSYIRFAVTRGFSKEYVLRHHATIPVLSQLLAALIAKFAWVFGGSTVLEFAFGIPGISTFLVESLQATDYPVLQTYMLIVILWMFIVHAIFNLVLQAIDPRRNL